MRIVYLDADFASAIGETGPRSHAFARRLIARGHALTMLTSDRQLGVPAGTGELFATKIDGVPVTAVNVGLGKQGSRLGRYWHHLRFALGAARYLLKCARPDVVYVTSPPLSVVVPVLLARWLRSIPFVLEVREVWPEVPHGVDAIRSRLAVFLLRWLALLGYRQAASVVALTDSALNHIQADMPLSRKVSKIGACCDLDLFGRGDRTRFRVGRGWDDKFVCLHVGSMTRSAGLEAILRVADVLREDEQFVFWLVGAGEYRKELERNVHDRELRNVFFSDEVPRSELPDVIAAADLCVLTARHYRVLEQAGAERLFDYLAAGRPVLLNYSGWQRDLLEEYGAGMGTALSEPGEFFDYICRLCDDPVRRAEMGANARRLAETQCHPDRWIDKLEKVLKAAAACSVAHPKSKPKNSNSRI